MNRDFSGERESRTVAVVPDQPGLADAAQNLARELNLAYFPERAREQVNATAHYFLVLREDRLQLEWAMAHAHRPTPLFVDFVGGAVGYRIRNSGSRQMIARAVGLRSNQQMWVVDPTVGLGRDAFVLATLGCTVTCAERNEIVWALLADGLRRALIDETTQAAAERLELHRGDGLVWLDELSTQSRRPDVVYLDPMFPPTSGGAAAKKELQLLRDIVRVRQDERAMLERALACARRRVVFKRPRHGGQIPGYTPSFTINGESARFDVFCLNGTAKDS